MYVFELKQDWCMKVAKKMCLDWMHVLYANVHKTKKGKDEEMGQETERLLDTKRYSDSEMSSLV